jgi:hypothetical protein
MKKNVPAARRRLQTMPHYTNAAAVLHITAKIAKLPTKGKIVLNAGWVRGWLFLRENKKGGLL